MTTAGRRRAGKGPDSDVITGYRSDLWRMADALRGSMDAAEYKHVVLGLIISDAFKEAYAQLEAERLLQLGRYWGRGLARWEQCRMNLIQARAPGTDV